ncbi:MAG TPA: flavin monoamine oxidase family protein [Candidatus Limnocylindria bacterium]|nr:flavin monoamine oxidase family protein [Candidatus Limnocylindria bacterium]
MTREGEREVDERGAAEREAAHEAEHGLAEAGVIQPLENIPESPELLATPREGLEHRPQPSKRVLVIGAGMAGLVAAFELKRQGHQPLVLEAQNRVGGRIYTLRDFAPGLYAEAGAMRIPRVHNLTLEYCRLFNLPLRTFMMGNPKGLVYVGGVRMTSQEAAADPGSLPFELAAHEQGRTADAMWAEAIADIREMIDRAPDEAWEEIVRKYDEYSLYEFLKMRGFSEGAIEYYAVMNFLEADMHNAVVEILREELGGAYVDMQEIAGGMDQLPNAFYRELQDEVRFGVEVRAIEQDSGSVTLFCRQGPDSFTLSGDYAICTVPFSVLRHIEKSFSRDKHRAIRQLNYHASTKILFQVHHRIWEERDGIYGGASVTDLPVRRLNYPTPDPSTTRGVLLASYTWGQDALQWGAMDNDTRIEEALDDVERIHPGIRHEFEVGASHAWYGDRWARGAFAMFAPEQQSNLYDDIVKPEGRVYFAGEHCSLYHAWIQGSLESGIRAAREIHELPPLEAAR